MKPRKVIRVRDVMDAGFLELDGLRTVKEALEAIGEGSPMPTIIIKKRHEDDEYGVVVLADIAKKILAQNRAPERVNLYEIMSKPAISVRPELDVRYCARMFDRFGISVAPVIGKDEIEGIVGYEGLLRGLSML